MRFNPAIDVVDGGLWRVRIQAGEITRNREMFSITDGEYALAQELVYGLLANVSNADQLPDVKRIRQTGGAWRRFRLDDLRIVYEPKHEREQFTHRRVPVIIWHMLLRKTWSDPDPDWIYDYVQERQQFLYPVKERDRKARLKG